MVLHAERWHIGTDKSLDRAVVEVAVGHGRTIDRRVRCRKVMVLARNLHDSGAEVSNRMVRPVMTKRQLGDLASKGQRHQLMPQSDSENGNLPKQALDRVLGIFHMRRIAGTIGQKHPIRLKRKHLLSSR